MYVHMYVCMYEFIYVCIYVDVQCTYLCTYSCMYLRIYASYKYIRTYVIFVYQCWSCKWPLECQLRAYHNN